MLTPVFSDVGGSGLESPVSNSVSSSAQFILVLANNPSFPVEMDWTLHNSQFRPYIESTVRASCEVWSFPVRLNHQPSLTELIAPTADRLEINPIRMKLLIRPISTRLLQILLAFSSNFT
jgi:hypothetical protein